MGTLSKLRHMTREEAAELFRLVEETKGLLGSVPHRDAVLIEFNLKTIGEIIEELFPGGFLSLCEGCGTPLGNEEVAATDNENALYFCAECMEEDKGSKDAANA